MEKTKVGVIGIGHLGRLHASLYTQVNDAELVGIYDTEAEKCSEKAGELGVKAYTNMTDLMEDVDAVNIVTPTTTHYEIAAQALELNKHVFIEKPVTVLPNGFKSTVVCARFSPSSQSPGAHSLLFC